MAESIRGILASVLPRSKVIVVVDRDYRSLGEVQEMRARDVIVPTKRNLESYLFVDDVTEALAARVGRPELISDALRVNKESPSGWHADAEGEG